VPIDFNTTARLLILKIKISIYKMGGNVSAPIVKKQPETREELLDRLIREGLEHKQTYINKLRENSVEEKKLDNRLDEIDSEIQTHMLFMYPKITREKAIEFYKEQNPNKIESLESEYNTLKIEKDRILSKIKKNEEEIAKLNRQKVEEAIERSKALRHLATQKMSRPY
jgi:hypothetical protein